MISKKALVLTGAVAVAIASGFFMFNRNSQAPHEAPSVVGKGTDGRSGDGDLSTLREGASASASMGTERRDLERVFDNVKTFGGLQTAISRGELDAGQGADYLRLAAMYCENSSRPLSRIQQQRTVTPSEQMRRDFARSFCKDFTGQPGEKDQLQSSVYFAQVVQNPGSDVAIAYEMKTEEPLSKGSQAVADKIVRTSKNPSAIVVAAQAMASAPPGSWDLGKDIAIKTGRVNDLPQAQLLAAEMLACDYSGGCGPNGYQAMMYCGPSQLCQPGVTMDQIWRNGNSPAVYQLAQDVYAELVQSRSPS